VQSQLLPQLFQHSRIVCYRTEKGGLNNAMLVDIGRTVVEIMAPGRLGSRGTQTTGSCRRQSTIQSFVLIKLWVGNGLFEIGSFGAADHGIFVLPCCPVTAPVEQLRRPISPNNDPEIATPTAMSTVRRVQQHGRREQADIKVRR
jgi:hypothetical protein